MSQYLNVELLRREKETLHPWGGQRAGFSAKTEIDRREWGLEWNQALETGGVLVGNSVRIELGVQAVKEDSRSRRPGPEGRPIDPSGSRAILCP